MLLDISENISIPLTVTGGLPFFGGAGNNYVTHSIATMMEKLRQDSNTKGLMHFKWMVCNKTWNRVIFKYSL